MLCLCAQAAHAQENNHPESITVVMDDNYPPYSFRDPDGQLQGILPDSWQLWSNKTGVQVKIIATDWGKALPILYAGKADVVDTISKNAERQRLLDYSQPYATIDVPIFFHRSISGISNVKNLGGFTVGVKEGDMVSDWLTARGIKNFRKYPSSEALIRAAKNDDIKVFVMGKPPSMYWLYKNNLEDEFRHSASLFDSQFHWATRKGDAALHQMVERGFKQISLQDRTEIEAKWMGAPLGGRPELQFAKYISYTLLLVLGISASLALLNWTLRRKVSAKTAELSSTLDALRSSERYSRMLFERSRLGLGLCRMDGTLVDLNQSLADIIGYTIEEAKQLTYWQITPHEYEAQEQQQMAMFLDVGHFGPYEKEYIHKSGKRIPVRLLGSMFEKDGERFIWASVEDITEQKAVEARINFLAFHDALTGLPNRLLALDRFEQAIAHADRTNTKVALLFFDLDNFKAVNDTLGHSTGDALLRSVAARLTECLRDTDTISRQGGDEFLVVLPALTDTDSVVTALDKVMSRLQEPFEIDAHELGTSVSVGVAIFPDDGRDFDTLMKNADIAMYQAKDAGRNAYRFFDEKMQADAMERLSIGSGLRRALERRELELYYQPLIDLASGDVVGAEALLRWNHPEWGMIAPARFIPVAEDTGMIVPIGEWVLHEACRQAVLWQHAGWPNLQMAVNLSAVQFRRADLEQTLIAALESSRIDPMLLELELTESILINNTEIVLATARRLKSLGVKLSIDDFGTGYSSLSYLKRFSVDKLKIDRSFIRDLIADPDDAAIVLAIIQMARNLGLKTIAEGVEDAKTLEWLRLFLCDQAQGYYFAKPMSADDFAAYLADKSRPGGM